MVFGFANLLQHYKTFSGISFAPLANILCICSYRWPCYTFHIPKCFLRQSNKIILSNGPKPNNYGVCKFSESLLCAFSRVQLCCSSAFLGETISHIKDPVGCLTFLFEAGVGLDGVFLRCSESSSQAMPTI